METRKSTNPYPGELRDRAVRMVRERASEHASEWAAILADECYTNPAAADNGVASLASSEERVYRLPPV